MEIRIHSSSYGKNLIINNSIVSIQSDNESLINNLINDYNPVVIENNNLFFIGETVLDEISLFNRYPELVIVEIAFCSWD